MWWDFQVIARESISNDIVFAQYFNKILTPKELETKFKTLLIFS